MLAMQYSVRLPREYDADKVTERVSQRGPMFDGYPGLAHKLYLYDDEEHIYAPFYIWENSQAAQSFLMHSLFGDVVQDFGRPRVRSWQILDFGYGSSTAMPVSMVTETDKVCEKHALKDIKAREEKGHQDALKAEGLFSHMVLLDPDRWEITRVSLWESKEKEVATRADCVHHYDVLQENRLLSGAA